MPPRRSARISAAVSETATPSVTVSPILSNNNSVQETPATTPEPEKEAPKRSTRGRKAQTTKPIPARTQKKRPLESQSDSDNEDAVKTRPKKKRAVLSAHVDRSVKKTPVVEITQKAKGKGGKAKATVPSIPTPDTQEEDLIDEDEGLDYDDEVEFDESDDSGSEFQASDSDVAEVVEDSEDEQIFPAKALSRKRSTASVVEHSDSSDEVMLEVALQESLVTARLEQAARSGASSAAAGSSKAAAGPSRTRAKGRGAVHVHDSSEEDDYAPTSDEDSRKFAGKGKASVKAVKKQAPKPMTVYERRRVQRESRLAAKARKREEHALRSKLGRNLTHAEKSTIALQRNHPELKDVWGDLERDIPIPVPQRADPPPNLKVTLLPFQRESLHWMKIQEKGVWSGGLLADEMGMGKTIQMIALLCTDPENKPNLVVAPTVAVMQWKNEIEAHSEGLKVLVWHGASRESNVKELKKFNVVLTTYAVLESCFRKQQSGFKRKGAIVKEKSVLHQIKWNRIILDEAHNIKERQTNTAKATFELQSQYKWCLSGTPLQNRVGELYSMIRFLGGDPFSFYFCKQCDCKALHWSFSDKKSCDYCGHSPMKHTCFWNNEILTPIQKNGMIGPGAIAFKKLKILLDRMMLRRTKLQRADDLGLPPRTVVIRRDYFSPEEKELYLSLFSDAKRQFTTYVDSGTVLNNYSNIFSLLTRMRQMACHPDLVLRSKTNANTFLPDNMGEATVCRLCNDVAEDAIQSKCRHIFDRECIKQYLNTAIEATPACPVCHIPLTIDLEAPALELEENVVVRQGILGRLDLDKWRSSSKIEALVEELCKLRKEDATTKSIVFSQFVNFLDLIAYRLQKAGFTICRLEGTMSPQARDATIKHFMNNVHVTVFLVSLKAGGVALNLTEASRVYLMDSWWNPAVEYQAMDRIHRLGQHRPVQAIKLVIEDSIESRIVQLQEKKAAMVDATLSADDSAMGRLTPADVSTVASYQPSLR
ncbi:hypothetical protein K474DRAFT_1655071 [Panus rudis PR-1116 ss-1]|nr:hypothetical protein K474DRAFT_1655071 [Panus rudis PR-1116 ss-1]